MENFLFSKKNVDNQCLQLIKVMKLQNTPKNVQLCRSMVTQRIKGLYDKYGNKKPASMEPKEFINKLCNHTST